ncbi:hypothetical protein INR49_020212 [Caranx melampygus]|nr:hypothetical protein INR49_020212 [Caranx melampygus]
METEQLLDVTPVPGGGRDPADAEPPAVTEQEVPRGPASPSAAKRLYRNLSEKLRGSTSSFEDAYFFGKTDRLRKASVSRSPRQNPFLNMSHIKLIYSVYGS